MRIGMLTDMYKPHVSGVTNYIDLYRAQLERLGHEVVIVTFGNRGNDDGEEHVVRSPALAWGTTGWQAGFVHSPEAREAIRSCDILHAHHPFVSGPLGLLLRRPETPLVFTNHTRYDLYADVYARFAPRALRQWFVRWRAGSFMRRADLVLAPSPAIRDWLVQSGLADAPVVLRNAIDTERFARPARPLSKQDLSLPPDSVAAVYLGRIGEEKNISLLTEAFICASTRAPHVSLLVIGDGPARAHMQQSIANAGLSDRAVFLGTVPYRDLPDRLAAGDLLVTASVSETYPLVVMEAGAAGLPCVGVRSAGVGEVVEHGASGLLAEENVSSYTDALVSVATDAHLRQRLAEGARSASASHDIRRAADKLVGHYEQLIALRS